MKVVPVILCGGTGSRLWPLSRSGFPKQFLVLSGNTSLFQEAASRVNSLTDASNIGKTLVVTNEEHRFMVLDQLRELPEVKATLLLEPVGKNTAPALTLAALEAMADEEDPILVVTPADQTILDEAAYQHALRQAILVANKGSIVVLGVTPDRPETGFGYIKREGDLGPYGEYSVAQFVEKPNLDHAKEYLSTGQYAWNSGIFVVKASVWLKALKHFNVAIFDATSSAYAKALREASFVRPDIDLFKLIRSDSVDYAVIEQCPGTEFLVKMIPLDVGWSDLGSWDAVWEVGEKDAFGNVLVGDVLIENTTNTVVHAGHRMVGVLGVSDLIIVETSDALLVADKKSAQQVKMIVNQLESANREEHRLHRKVLRPWGWYDSIDHGQNFKVKRIQVNPGASLSLQKHTHRAEHWVVVKGEARVTCGEKIIDLKENQSTYIPQGEKHRLSNPGDVPLEIIEVQTGSYLGEDDICRFEDSYGRLNNGS